MKASIHIRTDIAMGTAESKDNHRYRSGKHLRYKGETAVSQKCHHTNKQLTAGNKTSLKHETLEPLITSLPLNPRLQGSLLNHSFPLQRSQSEIQVTPYNELTGSPNQYDQPKGEYDYRKHMQRVDEENRPVLEGLCPDKMYVSTNDLRICDTQRLPPPLRCKVTQGFFRLIPPPQYNQKKTTFNTSFL